MNKIKLGRILENSARLAGRQVTLMGVPENWRALAGLAIGDGIRRIAAEKFPMMQRVEFRTFRPPWTSNDGWTMGQECWYADNYWRLTAEESLAKPDQAGSGWRKLHPEEVVAFIAFDQPWENTVIDRSAVDVDRFAYAADPKLKPDASPIRSALCELGVVLQAPAPNGVWCKFVPSYPHVSFIEWSGASAYEAGETAYLTSTKECYQCISDVAAPATGTSSNPSPSDDHDHWESIRISDVFENFLTRLLASDFLTEDQGKFQTKAAAEKEFEEICARYHEGNGECRVRTGRFTR